MGLLKRRKGVGSLFKYSATYAAGDLLEKAIGLAMLPAYVYFLAPADFGIIALVGTVTGLGGAVLSLGVYQSIVRYYHNPPEAKDGQQIVGAAWLVLMIVPAAAIVALLTIGRPVLEFLLEGLSYGRYILVAMLITYCNVAFIETVLAVTRTRALVRRYVTVVLLRAILTALFALAILVMVDQPSAFEVILSQAVATLLCSMYSIRLLLSEARLSSSAQLFGPLLRFGIPLMPLSSSQWALRVQDRLILNRFVALSDIGAYAVGQRVASPMQILMAAGVRTLQPMMSQAARGQDLSGLRSAVVRIYGVGTVICLFGSLLAPTVSRALLPPAYGDSAELTAVLIPGLFAAAVFQLASSASVFYGGKTYRMTLLALIAAVMNGALNLVLIPIHGIYGAALASLVTSVILAVAAWSTSPLPALLENVRRSLFWTTASGALLLFGGAWLNASAFSGHIGGLLMSLAVLAALTVQAFVVNLTIKKAGHERD
ncbi:hypothetical protein GCM10010531_38940 [Blastococcus jejuensis]|uniref:Membrane protein involved in the export of O-antigen and teichoic acid n=1 Tax=Blastococcus jejuensis TaxID=351224 RepID=A0ABP6PKE4_9ACTN